MRHVSPSSSEIALRSGLRGWWVSPEPGIEAAYGGVSFQIRSRSPPGMRFMQVATDGESSPVGSGVLQVSPASVDQPRYSVPRKVRSTASSEPSRRSITAGSSAPRFGRSIFTRLSRHVSPSSSEYRQNACQWSPFP